MVIADYDDSERELEFHSDAICACADCERKRKCE